MKVFNMPLHIKDSILGFFPEVRHMVREDIPQVSALDIATYGGTVSIGEEALNGWFGKYSLGAFVLVRKNTHKFNLNEEVLNEEVVGAFGVWPVSKGTFKKCKRGQITEEQVIVVKIKSGRTHGYWYLSDVILREEFRKNGLGLIGYGHTLIYESLRQWCQDNAMSHPQFNFCAIPITVKPFPSANSAPQSAEYPLDKSKSTERLLQKYRFERSKFPNEHGSYCYTRTMNVANVEEIYNEYYFRTRKCRASKIIRMAWNFIPYLK